MCLESLVAIMALIAACTLEPGVYLSMNVKGDPAATIAKVNALDFPVTQEQMAQMANQIGEKTLFGRTGGAATLAVGMAQIFSRSVNGRWLDLWYHFAIMFEALFILTTLDAGTRVGRYLLQDVLGNIWKPLGETRNIKANVLASVLVVSGWGYFLIQGVRDPLGGINSLWPLFGIANQLLAAIALCLGTTIILKMALNGDVAPVTASSPRPSPPEDERGRDGATTDRGSRVVKPAMALITMIPLIWLLAVTMTAGAQKIFHSDPRIGFLAQAHILLDKQPALEKALATAKSAGSAASIEVATKELHSNRVLRFNNLLDAFVTAGFLVLVAAIAMLSIREWILLLARRKLALLRESEPVWLPDYALAEARPLHLLGLIALALALAKELSGEAHFERAQQSAKICSHCQPARGGAAAETDRPYNKTDQQLYLELTEGRFNGVTRCC
jgi:carbon starvation protein